MKKLFLTLLTLTICLICNSRVYSQFFEAGLTFGVNGSQITGDNMRGFNKGGLNSGVFVQHRLINNERITLRMALNYTQKGSRRLLDPYAVTPGIWDLYRSDYLEIPLTFNYYLFNHWGISAGLALAFNVNEKYIPRDGSDFEDFHLAKKTEASSVFGLTYHLNDKFEFFGFYQSSIYNFSTASNTPFWQLWGDVRKGYIHVLTSAGVRYYFRPR